MAYLLDANVFIEAKNRHYGFDFCPAFWDWLKKGHTVGKVFIEFCINNAMVRIKKGEGRIAGCSREVAPAKWRCCRWLG